MGSGTGPGGSAHPATRRADRRHGPEQLILLAERKGVAGQPLALDGIDGSIGDEDILPAVEIEVDRLGAEAGRWQGRSRQAQRGGAILEPSAPTKLNAKPIGNYLKRIF